MADRTCDRCGTKFTYPWKLRRHLQRKTPCAPILELEDLPAEVLEDPNLEMKKCRFCGRVLSSYDSMRRHVRSACQIAPNEKNGDAGMEQLYEHTIRKQQQQIEEMGRQMAEMTGMMEKLLDGATPGTAANAAAGGSAAAGDASAAAGETAVSGDGAVVMQDRRVSVTINLFGQESVDHVTKDKIHDVLVESMRVPNLPEAASQAVMKAALLIYSDPEHPENLTCYLPNKREKSALVHASREDGTAGWEVRPLQIVAPPMAQRSIGELFDKQPFDDAEACGPLLAELRNNEARYATGSEMRPVLIRNKDLLARALETLPVANSVIEGADC